VLRKLKDSEYVHLFRTIPVNGTADSQIRGLRVELVEQLIHVLQTTMQAVGPLPYRHRVEQNVVPEQRSADTSIGIEQYAQQGEDESRGPSAQSVGQLRPFGARSSNVAGVNVEVTYAIQHSLQQSHVFQKTRLDLTKND